MDGELFRKLRTYMKKSENLWQIFERKQKSRWNLLKLEIWDQPDIIGDYVAPVRFETIGTCIQVSDDQISMYLSGLLIIWIVGWSFTGSQFAYIQFTNEKATKQFETLETFKMRRWNFELRLTVFTMERCDEKTDQMTHLALFGKDF
jgi:hypothetical protein